jgi:large subunit ribosomal protein L37e
MTKGTASHGKMGDKKTHIPCRRCGNRAYNIRHSICASCGFGKTARKRSYGWAKLH